MVSIQQRQAEQVEALSLICETLVIRILDVEERLETLNRMMNDLMASRSSESDLSHRASAKSLDAADATIKSLSNCLDAPGFKVCPPVSLLAQPERSDQRLSDSQHMEFGPDDSNFLDDENQEAIIENAYLNDGPGDVQAA